MIGGDFFKWALALVRFVDLVGEPSILFVIDACMTGCAFFCIFPISKFSSFRSRKQFEIRTRTARCEKKRMDLVLRTPSITNKFNDQSINRLFLRLWMIWFEAFFSSIHYLWLDNINDHYYLCILFFLLLSLSFVCVCVLPSMMPNINFDRCFDVHPSKWYTIHDNDYDYDYHRHYQQQ